MGWVLEVRVCPAVNRAAGTRTVGRLVRLAAQWPAGPGVLSHMRGLSVHGWPIAYRWYGVDGMYTVSATTARANLYGLIDRVNDESEPTTITG